MLIAEHINIDRDLTRSVLASFSLSMIIGRIKADQIVEHFGPGRVLLMEGLSVPPNCRVTLIISELAARVLYSKS